jgi:hypothetical protein
LDSRVLGLTGTLTSLERLEKFSVKRIFPLVLRQLELESFVLWAGLPSDLELVWRPRDLVLVSLSGSPLENGSETGEEVWSRLLVVTVESHVDEELLGLASAPEEDRSTLVQDDDLVEDVVGRLGSLVDGDAGDGSAERETGLDGTTE